MKLAAALLSVASLLLLGCVSSADHPHLGPVSNKDAARANVQLGVAYMQQGQLAYAKEKLERAVHQDPQNFEVHTSLAYLYERLNQRDKAEAEYRTAMRLVPGNSDVANNYAVFLCRNGNVERALVEFDTAAKDPLYTTPWAALTNAGICLRSAKRGADAVHYLEQAIYQRPNYAAAVFELADLQLELGAPGVASHVVERYLSMGIAAPDVLLVGVRAALALDDRATADAYARRLRRDFPESEQTRALPQLFGGRG